MTLPEALQKMFPKKGRNEMSEIWTRVFSPNLSAIMHRPTFDIMALDDCLVEYYGAYEGSMKQFIKDKFGEVFATQFNELITI